MANVSMQTRQSIVFGVLLAALIGVIVQVPQSERTDRVGSNPPRAQVPSRGGRFLPGSDDPASPDGVLAPPVAVDRSGPTCSLMDEVGRFHVVSSEAVGISGGDALPAPLPSSKLVYSVAKGNLGESITLAPTTANPIRGTSYLTTVGSYEPLNQDPGTSAGVRNYVALERVDANASPVAVVAFDNCRAIDVASPIDGAPGNLWLVVGGESGSGTLAELDPSTGRVLWSDVGATGTSRVADAGLQVLLYRFDPEGTTVSVLDKVSHEVVSTFNLGLRTPIESADGNLWATSGDGLDRFVLERIRPADGTAQASFDLVKQAPGVTDVHVSGGRIWTRERGALVSRDRETFAELSRIEIGDGVSQVVFGNADAWVQIERPESNEVEIVHVDTRRGLSLSTRTFTPPVVKLLGGDAEGFWYEALRRDPSDPSVPIANTEAVFRYNGA